MSDWKSVLNADPIPWLLQEENPSVRYFAMTELMDIPDDNPEATKSKAQIMKTGVVPKILARQNGEGYWGIAEDFYVKSKYKGTVWSLMILAEMDADSNDERITATCDFILDMSQDRISGGFSHRGTHKNGGNHSRVLPCLTGNMVWSLIKFGYLKNPRLQKGIDWITTYQRFDDRTDKPPEGWPYGKAEPCWGKHTCSMGVIKALKALAEIPPDMRSKNVKDTIEKGAEYFLQHHVHKRSHSLDQVSKPGWLKFGFPLMYQTDALNILLILTKLGYHDDRMQEAIDLVLSKQDNEGKWLMENTYNGRMQVNIERKGKPSKWVTLNALKAIKGWYN
ncbi:MAG: nitrogen fixation protein NifH [Chloroflexota bacterium]|nr:nitrogen fixation protein NifH [Chloroflexota bacterium]